MADQIETQVKLASDSVHDCLCSGCEDSGLQIEAQHFCKCCQRLYCENCTVLHSQLFKNHAVIGRANRSDWPIAEVPLGYITQCEQHPEEKIKMFCKGHRKLCCIYCLHSDHRMCENVVRIEEAAKGIHVEKDIQNLRKNILARCDKFNSEHVDMEKQLETLQVSFDEILLEITSFQKKMTGVIEKLAQSSTLDLKTMFTRINETCTSEIQRHKELDKSYQLLQKGLQSMQQHSEQLAFILCRKYDDLSEETDSLTERKDNREIHFRFQPEALMMQLVSELGSLGKNQTYRNKPNKVIKVLDSTKHNIRNYPDSEDSEKAKIIGICELADSQFIIADSSSKNAKLLDDALKVLCHLSLPSKPKQMCNISAYSVAVIFDEYGVLQFIRVNSQRMIVERIIKLEHFCFGIGYNNDDIFVTGSNANNDDIFVTGSNAIYRYNIAGQRKQKLSIKNAGKCAVSPDGTTVYVTTYTNGNSCLTLKNAETLRPPSGNIQLSRPDGVHVTANGQVLVCCYGSKEVVQIDSEGKEILARFAVSGYPACVCYSKEKGILLVGLYDSNEIQVFKTS